MGKKPLDPSFRELRDRVQQGVIGVLEQVVMTTRDQAPPPASYLAQFGGLFRDMTIHDLNIARYLAGEIVEVQTMGANLTDPVIGAAGDVDAAMVVMRAASGMTDFATARTPLAAVGYAGWMIAEPEQDPTRAPALEFAARGYAHPRATVEALGLRVEA